MRGVADGAGLGEASAPGLSLSQMRQTDGAKASGRGADGAPSTSGRVERKEGYDMHKRCAVPQSRTS